MDFFWNVGDKLSVDRNDNLPKRKGERHSPHRLFRQKLVLPGEITVTAEKHRGRLVVRVESPDDER